MNQLEREIVEQVQADHDYVVGLRRYLHQHPELPKEEFETQKRIEQELDALGIAHRRVAGTGVYAELTGTKPAPESGERCIVLRADIDALPVTEENGAPYASLCPGKMHACGHDAHNASLIGAARILSANRDKFSGKVIFTWQPGEEIGYGARIIIDEGNIDEAQRSFGLHLASNVPVGSVVLMPGPNNASVDWFRISVHGLGAHVSTPEQGVDAAYIASQIVVAAQALVTRRTAPWIMCSPASEKSMPARPTMWWPRRRSWRAPSGSLPRRSGNRPRPGWRRWPRASRRSTGARRR